MEKDKIFIFGHRKPDTDSVAAAISLSYLKNKLGFNTEPRILSDTNPESKFVLDYFKVEEPKYLNDVKVEIKDVNYNKNYFINEHNSVYKCYLKMCELGVTMLPIVDKNQTLVGMVGMKNIAKEEIFNSDKHLDSSYENIIDALDGKNICKYNDDLVGNVIVASYETDTFIKNINLDENTIVIVGNRTDILNHILNNKIKLVILTGGFDLNEECLKQAQKNKINVISTKYDTFRTANMISLCNYLKTIMMTDEIITFNESDELNASLDIANKVKYTNYPIVDKHNKCLGMLRLSDVTDHKRKQCILVDHNTSLQSAVGIEEAEIIEVIDHHNIGGIGTTIPINFRNMPVGSTCTILYLIYKENNIEIPKNIAGLMLSGILSDTLILTSPTTTNIDKEVVPKLAKIAEVDYKTYGKEMIKAGASLKGKTEEDVIYTDFKNYPFNNLKLGLGQFSTVSADEILENKDKYIQAIEQICTREEYYLVAFFVTDVIENGSYVFYNKSAKDIIAKSFKITNLEQGTYLPGVVSRKKQVVPVILNALEN